MLQYFIAEQTFKYLHFPSTITDTSHIPSVITLAHHIPSVMTPTLVNSVQKLSRHMFFSITPSFPMSY